MRTKRTSCTGRPGRLVTFTALPAQDKPCIVPVICRFAQAPFRLRGNLRLSGNTARWQTVPSGKRQARTAPLHTAPSRISGQAFPALRLQFPFRLFPDKARPGSHLSSVHLFLPQMPSGSFSPPFSSSRKSVCPNRLCLRKLKMTCRICGKFRPDGKRKGDATHAFFVRTAFRLRHCRPVLPAQYSRRPGFLFMNGGLAIVQSVKRLFHKREKACLSHAGTTRNDTRSPRPVPRTAPDASKPEKRRFRLSGKTAAATCFRDPADCASVSASGRKPGQPISVQAWRWGTTEIVPPGKPPVFPVPAIRLPDFPAMSRRQWKYRLRPQRVYRPLLLLLSGDISKKQ